MSDQMLLYILRAPQSPDDHLAMVQLISRAREAADLLEANAAEIASLGALIKSSDTDSQKVRDECIGLVAKNLRLEAENEKLREANDFNCKTLDQMEEMLLVERKRLSAFEALYEAVKVLHDVADEDCYWGDQGRAMIAVDRALAAVEQSEDQ